MLIIEIALGIILAVLILRFLPTIVAGAILLALVAAFILIVALVWLNLKDVAAVVGALAVVAVVYGIPFWLKDKIAQRYPTFDALIKGNPPYNQLVKQPFRITVMALFAVTLAAVGAGSLFGSLFVVDAITNALEK